MSESIKQTAIIRSAFTYPVHALEPQPAIVKQVDAARMKKPEEAPKKEKTETVNLSKGYIKPPRYDFF